MQKNIRYGFLTPENDGVMVQMKKGQNIAGYPIGIIYIDDVYYPMMPGNVVNAYTYDFPVRLRAVKGLDVPNLFQAKDEILPMILEACEDLKREGVRAISAACGFFGNYQAQVADRMNIPVAISSLVQVPWVATLLKSDQKIGVLTADKSSLGEKLFKSCGINDEVKDRLIIKDLRYAPNFNCVVEGRGEFNNALAKDEVVAKAKEIIDECDSIGAIILECSDMPPYAYAVQEATGVPVFDFITLIKWLHSSVCQMPYRGFI